jgi:signal transduction histidine kinase
MGFKYKYWGDKIMIENNNSDIDIDSLEIKDVIDINLLQTFQDNFAESMDIASVTIDRNGNPVTNPSSYTSFCTDFVHSTVIGDNRCAKSHKIGGEKALQMGKPYIYTCHAGLIDFAAPILVGGKHIGTILGGQILTKRPEKSRYIRTAKEIGVNEDKFVAAVKEVKITSNKNIKAAAEVLFIIANALSKIGYEELKLKNTSEKLEIEVINKNLLLEESKKYNELKTQLFSMISHELKTPLNIIFSSLQLIEDTCICNPYCSRSEMFSKYSKIMKQNCYRLIRMINNLIDMNKIELGFYNMKLENSNIVEVIENITLSIVEYSRLKNINLTFDTEIEEKITCCDSEKLERIMLNLLSNAIKFTNPGGNIYINIYDGNDYILISVKDTGIGIPENMLEKIFETFTQVDSSIRRNTEGSGIGLSLVKSLVEMQGGEISVKSQLGIGSEFIIKLPTKHMESEFNLCNQGVNNVNDHVEKIRIEFSDIY